MFRSAWLALALVGGLSSCLRESPVGLLAMGGDPATFLEPLAPDASYRFLVAGHTYGRHDAPAAGLFEPLLEAWTKPAAVADARFVVLCGDAVVNPHPDNFEALDRDLARLGLPAFLAPGNHDTLKREDLPDVVSLRYERRRLAFRHGPDAFCVADTAKGGGNIGGADLAAVRELLAGEPRALFVFLHHLVWVDERKVAAGEAPAGAVNGLVGYAQEGNFDTEVLPRLLASSAQVILIAGDLGAGSDEVASYERRGPNVHLLATGMGEHPGVGSWLSIEVSGEGIEIEVRGLGDEPLLTRHEIGF